jgi:hypothetical protein
MNIELRSQAKVFQYLISCYLRRVLLHIAGNRYIASTGNPTGALFYIRRAIGFQIKFRAPPVLH